MSKKFADRQAYLERKWVRVRLVDQQGLDCTVLTQDGFEIDLPYTHVRALRPNCESCRGRIYHGSYQAENGVSFCKPCYASLDEKAIQLYFKGPQWIGWKGQIAIRDMDDSHLVNTLGFMEKNAKRAAEATGGGIAEYLHPEFGAMVAELKRRRPEAEQVKVNSMLLYVWTVIYMLFGRQLGDDREQG